MATYAAGMAGFLLGIAGVLLDLISPEVFLGVVLISTVVALFGMWKIGNEE